MTIFDKLKKWKNKEKITEKSAQKNKGLQGLFLQKIILFFATLIIFIMILSINFFPDKIVLKEGQISSRDILSPKTVEFIDLEATQNLKEKAAKSIKEVYDLNLANIKNVEKQIDNIFLKIKEYKKTLTESSNYANINAENVERLTDEELKKIAREIIEDLGININENIIVSCFRLDDLSLEKINRDIKNTVRKIMEQGIKESDLESAKKRLVREISEISLNHYDALIASEIGNAVILPSLFLNEKETEKRRQEAISSVKEVKKTIQKGQIIIRKGEIATSEDIAILNVLGLQNPEFNYTNVIGIILITSILVILVVLYLSYFHPGIYEDIN